MQQIIEPTGTMGDLLFTLQKFILEDQHLEPYFGKRTICQNELYNINYCSPFEKNILLTYLFQLFNAQEDIPKQDVLYIDTQHNFLIPNYVLVAKCYSPEDLVIQLNAARYVLKKNRKIRMIIIDSRNQKSRDYKRKTSRTIGEKIIQFDKEVELVTEELINSLREFNAIIIVLNIISYPQHAIKFTSNNQFVITEKIAGGLLENNIYLIPPLFYDQDLQNYINNINQNSFPNIFISIMESKSKLRYYIFDEKQIISSGEAISEH